MLDMKTTFGNIVRDQSVSICMLQPVISIPTIPIPPCSDPLSTNEIWNQSTESYL